MGTGAGEVLSSSISNWNILGNASGIEGVITGVIIFLVFLWVMGIIWTARDVSARTSSTILQIISILLVTVLTPVVGLPLYLAMRPIAYKKDMIPWRESSAMNLVVCYNCSTLNPKEYNCCIACGERLKLKCKECSSEYPHDYQYCNSCGAPNLEVE